MYLNYDYNNNIFVFFSDYLMNHQLQKNSDELNVLPLIKENTTATSVSCILKPELQNTKNLPSPLQFEHLLTKVNDQHSTIPGRLAPVDEKPERSSLLVTTQNVMLRNEKHNRGVHFERFQDQLPLTNYFIGHSNDAKKQNKRKHIIQTNYSNTAATAIHFKIKESEQECDTSSSCSTCSASSSGTDDVAYQIPQRRHYGGVRVNYVPNDALACVKNTKQKSCVKKGNTNCLIS